MITPALEILNQKGTPMFNSDLFSNRPTAGIQGRIFISTDTKEFYRDTGSTWELIGGPGSGTVTGSGTATQVAIWNSASNLTGTNNLYWDATNNRLGINTNTPGVSLDVHGTNVIAQLNGTGTTNAQVTFQNAGANKWQIGNIYSAGSNYFRIQDNASNIERVKLENTGAFTLLGYYQSIRTETATAGNGFHGLYSWDVITIPASTTFTNNGNSFGSIVGRSNMTYQGSASFGNANVPSAILGTNIFDFSSGSGTITIGQGSGLRTFSALTAFNQVNSATIGTITHLSGINVLAPYSQAGTANATNYYGLLINASDERSAFNITNKWGIYQEGTNDRNYFASRILIGSPVDNGSALQVTGSATISGTSVIGSGNNGVINLGDNAYRGIINYSAGSGLWYFNNQSSGASSLDYYQFQADGSAVLTLKKNGAATFSGSVTAGDNINIATIANADTKYFRGSFNGSNTSSNLSSVIFSGGDGSQNRGGMKVYQVWNGAYTDTCLNLFTTKGGIGQSSGLNIDGVGNVGIGVTPSAWSTSGVLEVGGFASSFSTIYGTDITFNAYWNSGWKYKSSSYGSSWYSQDNNQHKWYTAPSGTAGNPISFTQAMTLNASGNLLIGSTVDTGNKLYLNGSLRIDGQRSGTSSGNSGQHLIIVCDGITYKIALLNP